MALPSLDRVVSGDADAWHELWAVAEKVIWPITANRRVFGRLAAREDERREVVVRVMQRLREDDFVRLRTFIDEAGERAERAFPFWLAVVTTRAAIDHLRAHEHYRDRRTDDGAPRWIDVAPLDDGLREPEQTLTAEELATARTTLFYARGTLREEQCAALEAWLEGRNADEIAAHLGLVDRHAAARLVRSALKRLRDHFGSTRKLRTTS